MDCEKFDRVVLDLLYDELDELTAAAAQRHMDHCARCGPIGNGLRATREVGALPSVEPPAGLRERILAAERQAHAGLPLRQRLGRAVSILAGYAMRPQLAMAAVLVLMVGMSLMFLQPQPGSRDSVRVTERGVPELEPEAIAEPPVEQQKGSDLRPDLARQRAPHDEPMAKKERVAKEATADEAEPAVASAEAESPLEDAKRDFRAGNYTEAERKFEEIAAANPEEAAQAELWAARAARHTKGCLTAIPLLENVAARHAGTGTAHEATWLAADCQRSLGRIAAARQAYQSLVEVPDYTERARNALDALAPPGDLVATRRAVSRPSPARAAAAKPAAAVAAPSTPSASATTADP